jgi:hypothetical protein
MNDVAERSYELLRAIYSDLQHVRASGREMDRSITAIEKLCVATSGHLAQIRIELDDIRSDVSQIKRRLDMVEA